MKIGDGTTHLTLALVFGTLVSVGMSACGGSGHGVGVGKTNARIVHTGTAAQTATSATPTRGAQTEQHEHWYVTGDLTEYGHEASAADARAVATLVTSYYAAAAADDGAKACSLLYSIREESIPEDLGQAPAPRDLWGKTCAVVMAKLFKHVGQSSGVLAGTRVIGVRVMGNSGFALLRSRAMSIGDMSIERERGTWKMDNVIDDACSACTVPRDAATDPPYSTDLKDAKDGDEDPSSHDDESIVEFGHAGSAVELQYVDALVKSYYTAVVANNGAAACGLLYGLVAETIAEEERADSPGFDGTTCAAAMSRLLKSHYAQKPLDLAKFKLTRLRVGGVKAYAFVYLGSVPEPYLTLHREGGSWKVQSLFAVVLP